jgi:hypothetical protein
MWEVPIYPRKFVDWPKEVYLRWNLKWIIIYAALQLVGAVVALTHEVLESRASTDVNAYPFTVTDAIAVGALVFAFDLVGAILSISLLWIYGRRRGRIGFRVLSLLTILLVGLPIQVCFISSEQLATPWLIAAAVIIVVIRQPKPASNKVSP